MAEESLENPHTYAEHGHGSDKGSGDERQISDGLQHCRQKTVGGPLQATQAEHEQKKRVRGGLAVVVPRCLTMSMIRGKV